VGRKIRNTMKDYQNYMCQLHYEANALMEYSLNMIALNWTHGITFLPLTLVQSIIQYLVGSGGLFIEYGNIIWLLTIWRGIISQKTWIFNIIWITVTEGLAVQIETIAVHLTMLSGYTNVFFFYCPFYTFHNK
jgi:hypothetical protein